ncbi:MAG: hypothetical protein D6737_15995 [Chloroflexi bacterium]|nr:MAG: hypothetical protein D6737_15995 [Chloroflexota bacterium]
MAIDYIIDYKCFPKQELDTDGIVQRLKDRARAEEIIRLYRREGDTRPPSQMGFELTRTTPDGEETTEVVNVQHLLYRASTLDQYTPYCDGCPANRTGEPFGCVGFIQYPISLAAEAWLLKQLPVPDDTLVWLLLKQGVQELGYDGAQVAELRTAESPYFESADTLARTLGEFQITSNQVFEMIFLLGHIQPHHAGMLLLFFHAIARDLEADEIMHITPAPVDFAEQHPFLYQPDPADDTTTSEFKQFFLALYLAWGLNVPLLLDV